MPGVVSADVSCVTGKAVCKVKPGTDADALVKAVDDIGFATRVKN